jgi:hypothetical protein
VSIRTQQNNSGHCRRDEWIESRCRNCRRKKQFFFCIQKIAGRRSSEAKDLMKIRERTTHLSVRVLILELGIKDFTPWIVGWWPRVIRTLSNPVHRCDFQAGGSRVEKYRSRSRRPSHELAPPVGDVSKHRRRRRHAGHALVLSPWLARVCLIC